ncbi:PREDICTED: gap junction delta-3 protein [Calidris pugnax]|uniref:gap junction delta-3 protein n=1 Tax=Calidris pugnax TaxID=198806 RepID=UPI00071C3BAC|nr:PREDICTED: gap junction delta-3 protein [Calidris pugnax]
MGEWGFLSSLLDAVQEHSPMVGRFWLVVMLLFRILVLATVGSDVFEDEQEEFVCNTQQPGCKPVCYDAAFPISHYRFLVFHVVVLSAPAALFVIFAVHQAAKPGGGGGAPGQRARRLQPFYVGSVVARIAAELGFLLGQALLYGFRVQPLFVCRRRPCPHRVDCFVSRPTEKTVFIHFYFVVGLVSALLSLAELAHLLRKGPPTRAKPGGGGGAPSQRARRLQPFYVGSVVARIAAELGFLLGQALLYGFRVQPLFVCRRRPCPHRVDCFVSRPTEKTVFIHFYFVVGLVSALLSLAELAHLLRKGPPPRGGCCHRLQERGTAPGQPAEEPCRPNVSPPRGDLTV